MPFGALERPALGLSLLKAELDRRGIPCDVRYLAFDFASFVGLDDYRWIQAELPYTAFAGDWSFTRSLYGDRPDDDAYVEDILRRTWRLDEESIARILRIRAYCEHFLDHCIRSVPWGNYDVVGFTSTFEQNIASLALARRVKERFPSTAVVFGGANWEGEMGVALHERFPFVDFVCSGEADRSFPELLAHLGAGGSPQDVRGVVYRSEGETRSSGPAEMVRDLDALPVPNYDDFFRDSAATPATVDVTPILLLETSRGCWWGEKQHCTFCGLNGGTMAFRSKDARRVVEEIKSLRATYGVDSLSVVDNILDMRYFKTLMPMIVEEHLDMSLFYEVKANLTHAQLRQLASAGVRLIQPGLESFSDHVLGLMRKGTTALQNIQLLKWCRELGIRPEWNLLYGFPGEDPADYVEMLPLIDSISHLDPPAGYGPVRLDRFSPYHVDPVGYGMINVRALGPYAYLYPFDQVTLDRIAYYFDYDYRDGRDPSTYAGPVIERIQQWQRTEGRSALWVVPDGDDRSTVMAVRPGRPTESIRLEGWQARLYATCDRLHSQKRLLEMSRREGVPDETAIEFLHGGVRQGLIATVGDRYLALAVHSPPRTGDDGQRDSGEIPVFSATTGLGETMAV